jgi:hypothetical protein
MNKIRVHMSNREDENKIKKLNQNMKRNIQEVTVRTVNLSYTRQ